MLRDVYRVSEDDDDDDDESKLSNFCHKSVNTDQFLTHDATQSAVMQQQVFRTCLFVRLSVCLSVRPSVT